MPHAAAPTATCACTQKRPEMEELHGRIAAYLRGQRRTAEVWRPHAESAREAMILGLWRDRCDVPCCRFCGRAIVDGDELISVAQLRAARVCVKHAGAF